MSKIGWFFMIIFLLILGVILYARFVGTLGLKVKEYNIISEEIPESFYGTKIVHISDIHYGRATKGKELKKIVDEINIIEPDIVIFTGDLIDKDVELSNSSMNTLISELGRINSKLGKYAIWGNHDYEQSEFENIILQGDFKILKNDYDLIYSGSNEPIFIGGLDSMIEGNPNIDGVMNYFDTTDDENKILPDYRILLVHEPDYIDNVMNYNFDIVFSGHSHNGQVRLPVIGKIWTPIGSEKYYDEYYKVNDTDLYISSGIGTSKLNLRLFCKPSFNLYRLRNK